MLPGACTLNTVLQRGEDIHYTARGVHTKQSAGGRGQGMHYTARGVHTKHSAGERWRTYITVYCHGLTH
jgi:hypothetical protein